jgi:hypothetical protein
MRVMTRRGRTVVAAVSMGICFARSALAQVAPDAGPPRTVDVTIVAGGDDAEPLMGTIRELLGRLGLSVDPHIVTAAEVPSATNAPAGLSVRVDLVSRYEAVATVRRGNQEVRRTIPRDSSPAIVREEIGEAVRSGVEVQLLSEAAEHAAPPAPATPLPAPAPPSTPADLPPPSASSVRWAALDLAVLAGGGPIASNEVFVTRLGGAAVIASRRGLRPSLTLSGAFFVPFQPELSGVMMRTTIVSFRAVPGIEVVHASRIAVDVGAGVGLDVISVGPSAGNGTLVQLEPGSSRVDPMLTALATGYAAITPGIAFTLEVGGEVDLAFPQYSAEGPGGGDILDPWPVRPFALAGFTFTTFGSALFAARTP